MFEHKRIQGLNDYFIELNNRREKGIYFYRIHGYNNDVLNFVKQYYEIARTSGIVIEGRIPNPDERNLSYFGEIMGNDFVMHLGFITTSLKKWLPRMNEYQRNSIAAAIYDSLEELRKAGKNDNMLKNAYIKFMCWLYYKFERILNQLGDNIVPKILYEGEISTYELMLISILSNAGCDAVLLQYKGDEGYLKIDPSSAKSYACQLPGLVAFPETFNIKWIREEIQKQADNDRLYGRQPSIMNCTNAWIAGKGLEDIRTSFPNRGNDSTLFYNCYIRINGAEDKVTYQNELYQFQLELKKSGRKLVILEETIPIPTMDEINAIRRKNYNQQDQMLMDLAKNINYSANPELQRIMCKAYIDVLLKEAKLPGMNLNKLTNKAVFLLCWLKRYQEQLFSNWKTPEIGCFIYLGGCRNGNEAMFIRFLARIPVDVLILNPNLDNKCVLEDSLLYEINHINTLVVNRFPTENSELHIGTAAYHAERELDSLMYQDTGIYRNQQYNKANAVSLQTMYEEIGILWDQELKYRPNFSTVEDIVTMPVIFAKVSGVKDGLLPQYWASIKTLITNETVLIRSVPYINSTDANPIKSYATEFFKNGKLQKNKIKSHQSYQYGFLREEMQEYILDKLQLLIDQRSIKGTFENGTEYTIVATVLHMNMNLLRMIQKFDFTKKNPKFIYVNTTETIISLEDSILAAFLNLIGFDIIFFVPTGYQSVEKYFNKRLMEEHQIGEYMYDLNVSDLGTISSNNTRQSWREKIFRRGI